MTREEITKEAQEQVNCCTPYHTGSFIQGYITAVESLQAKYEKQKETNKELVDENEALKFAARMSEKTEKQLRAEIEEFKETNHELAELAIERQKEIDELEKCRQILSDCTDRQRKENHELSDCNGRLLDQAVAATKQTIELEKENEQLKSTAEFQQSSNMKRHFEIQKLEKENAELKKKIGIYQKGMYDEIEKRDRKLTKAKEIISAFVEWANWEGSNCPSFKSIQDKAEQFLKEIEK